MNLGRKVRRTPGFAKKKCGKIVQWLVSKWVFREGVLDFIKEFLYMIGVVRRKHPIMIRPLHDFSTLFFALKTSDLPTESHIQFGSEDFKKHIIKK